MDHDRFAAFTRALSALGSRRAILGALVGGALTASLLDQTVGAPAQAAKRKKRCPRARRCKGRCCSRGKVCKNGKCRPKSTPPSGTVRVRQNLHGLDPYGGVMQAYIRGVAAMRKRPASDPTSWAAQAALHADHCQHGTTQFLAWHRMYVYWFERIVRRASGDDTFALPYWDYSVPSQRVLPEPFRDPSSPLYISQRNASVNDGQVQTSDSTFDSSEAMDTTVFSADGGPSFAGGPSMRGLLENRPHNVVHSWVGGVGGYMSNVQDAALDPVFWMHHCNIDRAWEVWLSQGGGRANLTSGPFVSTQFTFYDEEGRPVQMTGSQILDTIGQLDYRYEGVASQVARTQASSGLTAANTGTRRLGTAPGGTLKLGAKGAALTIPTGGGGGDVATSSSERLFVTFKGVKGTAINGVAFDVHVNPKGGSPSSRDASYVDTIGFFGLRPQDHPGHGEHSVDIAFDITKQAGGSVPAKVRVVLVPVEYAPVTESGAWGEIASVEIGTNTVGTRKQKPARKRNGSGNGQGKNKKKPKQKSQARRGQRKTKQKAAATPQQRAAAKRRKNKRDGGPERERKRKHRRQPAKRKSAQTTSHEEMAATEMAAIPGNKSSLTDADLVMADATAHHQH